VQVNPGSTVLGFSDEPLNYDEPLSNWPNPPSMVGRGLGGKLVHYEQTVRARHWKHEQSVCFQFHLRPFSEGELRALQATTRADKTASDDVAVEARAKAAAEARTREAMLAAEVEALRAQADGRQAGGSHGKQARSTRPTLNLLLLIHASAQAFTVKVIR